MRSSNNCDNTPNGNKYEDNIKLCTSKIFFIVHLFLTDSFLDKEEMGKTMFLDWKVTKYILLSCQIILGSKMTCFA